MADRALTVLLSLFVIVGFHVDDPFRYLVVDRSDGFLCDERDVASRAMRALGQARFLARGGNSGIDDLVVVKRIRYTLFNQCRVASGADLSLGQARFGAGCGNFGEDGLQMVVGVDGKALNLGFVARAGACLLTRLGTSRGFGNGPCAKAMRVCTALTFARAAFDLSRALALGRGGRRVLGRRCRLTATCCEGNGARDRQNQ